MSVAESAMAYRQRQNIIRDATYRNNNPYYHQHLAPKDRIIVNKLIDKYLGKTRFDIDEITISRKGMVVGLEQILEAYVDTPDNIIQYADEINIRPSRGEYQHGLNEYLPNSKYDTITIYLGSIDERGNTGATFRHELAHAVWAQRYSNEFKKEFHERTFKIPYSITPYAESYRKFGEYHSDAGWWSFAEETHSEFMSIINHMETEPFESLWEDYPFNKVVFNAVDNIYQEMLGSPRWHNWEPHKGRKRT